MLVFSLCFAILAAASASAEEVLKLKLRSGVFLKMLVDAPAAAKAVVLLFPGGNGKVIVRNDGTFKGTKGNFLTRSRKKFAAHGLVTVLFDAPSDRRDLQGLSFDYRMTEEHAGDINQAVAKLRENFPGLPLWLVGTSRGSTSVANAGANINEGGAAAADDADGIVMTSSVGVSSRHGGNILDFNLASIKIPALVVHHVEDGCVVTPVTGARDIKAALTGSKAAEFMEFTGSSGSGKECGATSHHGFLEIEQKVIDAISSWIKSH